MGIKFSKSAVKFLNNLAEKEQAKIKEKLNFLVLMISNNGVIPFQQLDIKSLKGNWEGYLRLRIGKIRIIFRVDFRVNELFVYEIDSRGSVYK